MRCFWNLCMGYLWEVAHYSLFFCIGRSQHQFQRNWRVLLYNWCSNCFWRCWVDWSCGHYWRRCIFWGWFVGELLQLAKYLNCMIVWGSVELIIKAWMFQCLSCYDPLFWCIMLIFDKFAIFIHLLVWINQNCISTTKHLQNWDQAMPNQNR